MKFVDTRASRNLHYQHQQNYYYWILLKKVKKLYIKLLGLNTRNTLDIHTTSSTTCDNRWQTTKKTFKQLKTFAIKKMVETLLTYVHDSPEIYDKNKLQKTR